MVIKLNKENINIAANLAALLWKNYTVDYFIQEFSECVDKKDFAIFIKYEEKEPVGFAQCQLRYDYVEGTKNSPVGYLEGIFVNKEFRRKGYAKELLKYCEDWAKNLGCKEFASDCELYNEESFEFHKALKFSEANRIICFVKSL